MPLLRLSQSLPSRLHRVCAVRYLTTTPRLYYPSAPGPKDGPKSNATGLNTDSYGMKSGDDNTSKTPIDKQPNTPNVEAKSDKVKNGDEAHPAKTPESQPEPTRSTGIKGKEEMG